MAWSVQGVNLSSFHTFELWGLTQKGNLQTYRKFYDKYFKFNISVIIQLRFAKNVFGNILHYLYCRIKSELLKHQVEETLLYIYVLVPST